jgi:catechol 2,3-dioxygenase-like lactoylglutathione lyase family enzyme
MLGNREAIANVAVKDLPAAKRFYEGTLGLEQVDAEGDEVAVYAAGSSKLLVYHSQFAGTNKATAVTWRVGDDIDREVEQLKAKGVVFEHYDNMPDTRLEGDVHVSGARRVAWFKDPDGNIHNLVNQ